MNTTALVPLHDIREMAASIAKSNLFGAKTPDQAMALMLIAQAEGTHPALAARDYHIIQGRPALKADAMLSRFQAAGGVVEWQDYTDAKVSGRFSHPKSSPKPVLIEWTLAMAQRIGLAGKDNWKNYPRQMLRARVISEGCRTVYPGISIGIYTVEEAQDMLPERNMGAAQVVGEIPQDDVEKKIAEIQAATSRDALQALWKAAAEACRAANDAQAHARIKQAVMARLAIFDTEGAI